MIVSFVRPKRIKTLWICFDISGAPVIPTSQGNLDVSMLDIGYNYDFTNKLWSVVAVVSGIFASYESIVDLELGSPRHIPWIWQIVQENLPHHSLAG